MTLHIHDLSDWPAIDRGVDPHLFDQTTNGFVEGGCLVEIIDQ
jgi:hypothetical protein